MIKLQKQLWDSEQERENLEKELEGVKTQNVKFISDINIMKNEHSEIMHTMVKVERRLDELERENMWLKAGLESERKQHQQQQQEGVYQVQQQVYEQQPYQQQEFQPPQQQEGYRFDQEPVSEQMDIQSQNMEVISSEPDQRSYIGDSQRNLAQEKPPTESENRFMPFNPMKQYGGDRDSENFNVSNISSQKELYPVQKKPGKRRFLIPKPEPRHIETASFENMDQQ